jgi:thiamine biosynthesis lipoprotein
MTLRLNYISNFILLIFSVSLFISCSRTVKQENGYTVLKGKFLDEKYEIAYDSTIDLGQLVDSLIKESVAQLSSSTPNSIVFKYNSNQAISAAQSVFFHNNVHYLQNFDSICTNLILKTEGRFNPGLGQLEQYWFEIFKNNDKTEWSKYISDSLKKLDFGLGIEFNNLIPLKPNQQKQIWTDPILGGCIADKIAVLFDSVYGFKHYYINIAGTIKAKGGNGTDAFWPIKIEKPQINTQKIIHFAEIPLKNYAISTKTNFRKFHFLKGHRYSLALDALEGYPAKNEILSVSIQAPSALEATSVALACEVIGLEKSKVLIESNPNLKAFIIFEKDGILEHWATSNISFVLNTKE